MLTQARVNRIKGVIRDPAHGDEFYTPKMLKELCKKIEEILSGVPDLESFSRLQKIKWVEAFVKKNVSLRREYFDAMKGIVPQIPQKELQYRTAHGALVKGEAICVGFIEATRVLLESLDIETATLIAKLPEENKNLLHYVCCIEYDVNEDRKHYIVDPEREKNKKGKGENFYEYLSRMTFILPDQRFYDNKVGRTGIGMTFSEYVKDPSVKSVLGLESLERLLSQRQPKGGPK